MKSYPEYYLSSLSNCSANSTTLSSPPHSFHQWLTLETGLLLINVIWLKLAPYEQFDNLSIRNVKGNTPASHSFLSLLQT